MSLLYSVQREPIYCVRNQSFRDLQEDQYWWTLCDHLEKFWGWAYEAGYHHFGVQLPGAWPNSGQHMGWNQWQHWSMDAVEKLRNIIEGMKKRSSNPLSFWSYNGYITPDDNKRPLPYAEDNAVLRGDRNIRKELGYAEMAGIDMMVVDHSASSEDCEWLRKVGLLSNTITMGCEPIPHVKKNKVRTIDAARFPSWTSKAFLDKNPSLVLPIQLDPGFPSYCILNDKDDQNDEGLRKILEAGYGACVFSMGRDDPGPEWAFDVPDKCEQFMEGTW